MATIIGSTPELLADCLQMNRVLLRTIDYILVKAKNALFKGEQLSPQEITDLIADNLKDISSSKNP